MVIKHNNHRGAGDGNAVGLFVRQLVDRHQVRAKAGQGAIAQNNGNTRRTFGAGAKHLLGHQADIQRRQYAGIFLACLTQPNRERRFSRHQRRTLLQFEIQPLALINLRINIFQRQHHVAGGGRAIGKAVFHQHKGTHAGMKSRLIGNFRLAAATGLFG
ncbi:hypothetical protein D3C78_1037470 [compost metagenome]